MIKQTTKTVKSEAEKSDKIELAIAQKDISQVLKTLSSLVEEATFTFNEEGVSFRAMDCSHVALIDMALPNSIFEKYEIENEVKIAVRVDEAIKVINLFELKSTVRLSHNDHILNIHNNSESYKIRTIEENKSETPLPRLPYDSIVQFDKSTLVSVADFIKQLKKIETISSYVTFETTNNFFNLSGKGDVGDVEITNERGQVTIKKNCQNSNSTYSLEYLIPFLKSLQKDRSIEISYTTLKPLRIRTDLGGSSFIDFYLAPRVES